MAIEVRRRPNESNESFVRRFSRRVLQSGLVLRVKRSRFYEQKKNKRAVKIHALRRKYLLDKKEYLQKIGKLPPDDTLTRGGTKRNVKLPIRIPKFK